MTRSAKEVQPVPAEKRREVWPDLFQAHRGKVRVCEAQRNNEVPSGDFKRPNGLAQQDGGALPRQVPRLPGCMRPPRLCCGIKHTKSENLPPHAPQIDGFYLLSLFSPGLHPPFPGGCGAATRPSGRERNQDAPQEGAYNSTMRPVKSTQKGTFVWFGARRARKIKFSAFFCMAEVSGQELQSFTYYRPRWRQLNES